MIQTTNKILRSVFFFMICLAFLLSSISFADSNSDQILKSFGRTTGLFVVIGSGDKNAPAMAAALGENGDSLVHAIACDTKELGDFNKEIASKGVQGCVSAEQMGLAVLPYRDNMVNVIVIMDQKKAEDAGMKMSEVRRCLAPWGRLVTCEKGKVQNIEEIPMPAEMDIWTHRYHAADGIPQSTDKVFDLPVGYRWNGGLPMFFDNPKRSANRYSSTRALVVDDARCFTFSTGVYENLGDTWKSEYGKDQYLTCRDAFNGRLLWRKNVGDTYYGGLYIENMAPVVSTGKRIYLAGANGKMHAVDTRTGEMVREFDTAYIPGVIAASDGVVVAATWKDGKVMGSIEQYDRRRMDWAIGEGTMEAYNDETGNLMWTNNLLGTSMVIADGVVYIVSRSEKDDLEMNHNKKQEQLHRPPQKVIAMDLVKGTVLWETKDESLSGVGETMTLEAAGHGVVAVAVGDRNKVKLISKTTGNVVDGDAAKEVENKFFRYRGHICTPVMKVNDVLLNNRGGNLSKPGLNINYGGARSACLTGTIPAYGSAFIAQNWCNCSPAQIPGLISIGPIGREPTPAEMTAAIEPIMFGKYSSKDVTPDSSWSSFRANADRSSSAFCEILTNEAVVVWSKKVISSDIREGTVKRDWLSFLNSRLTAPVISGDIAIVGDIDHNEIIAVNTKDGSVAWRFMTGARMDTAPTLYNGICLAGDYTGYVSAIKVKDGELIYKLRVAPEEKRMMSYGKVESVWPVTGGVMVYEGKAYASAGRSQGSDGGLVVRAFVPETGRQIWARALPQRDNDIREQKPMRNDALVRNSEMVMMMRHRMDLNTGAIISFAIQEFKDKALRDVEKELGHRPNGQEQNELWKKLAPEMDKIPKADAAITTGNEGLYSWNWTRVGHRKFNGIGFHGFNGDTVSWTKDYIAACDKNNTLTFAYVGTPEEGSPVPNRARQNCKVADDRQVTSLAVCKNVILLGGSIRDKDGDKGFIQAISLADKSTVWDKTFYSKLAFNGLAVDGGQIFASFDDGTVACLK